jgi:hypothetical protein
MGVVAVVVSHIAKQSYLCKIEGKLASCFFVLGDNRVRHRAGQNTRGS